MEYGIRVVDPLRQYATESIFVGSFGWDAPLPLAVRVTQDVLVWGFPAAGLACLVTLVVAWRKKRRAPASRLALVIAPCALLATSGSMRHVSETFASIEPAYAAFLLAVPMLSLLAGVGGLAWIARHWQAVAEGACAACAHALLPEQTRCPECGASRVSADLSMRTRRRRRAESFTLLAFLSAIVGFLSIGAVGNATLPWRVAMSVYVEDDADSVIFAGTADAVVRASARHRRAEPEYGPRGGVRDVSAASIEHLHLLIKNTKAGIPCGGVMVLPPEGVGADAAWFDGVERSLADRPPEFARAGLSWARTVTARLRGGQAHSLFARSGGSREPNAG